MESGNACDHKVSQDCLQQEPDQIFNRLMLWSCVALDGMRRGMQHSKLDAGQF